ncbi:MAG: hypothetical protein KAS02_01880 [Candidatus Pacebacteria bacterium]|nr:hypothetical protein [Candidatus Paceibacterota bacterium]
MKNKPILGILEIDYLTPIKTRERLNFHTTEMDFLVDDLKKEGILLESIFICTCNRTLLIYICEQNKSDIAKKITISLFNKWAKINISLKYFNFYNDEKALNKLLRLSVGADSAMLGEDQILGQIKIFYKIALKKRLSGPILNRIIQNLFSTTRKIKVKYSISKGQISIPGIVIKEIDSSNLYKQKSMIKVLIIGWGDITRTIFKIFNSSRDKYIVSLSNRTFSNINVSAKKISLLEIKNVLNSFDIIISMTSRLGYMVNKIDLASSMNNHLLFDLGVPRNIDPKISNLKNVELFNIDDINQKSNINLKKRKKVMTLLMESRDFLFFQKKMLKFIHDYQFYNKKCKIIKEKMKMLKKENGFGKVLNKDDKKICNSMNKKLYRKMFGL